MKNKWIAYSIILGVLGLLCAVLGIACWYTVEALSSVLCGLSAVFVFYCGVASEKAMCCYRANKALKEMEEFSKMMDKVLNQIKQANTNPFEEGDNEKK